jgi:intracellular sulfur oxidation DsrE/DsrF family protein
MHRRLLGPLAFLAAAAGVSTTRAAVWRVPASKPKHRALLHVGSGDPAIMAAALHNILNLAEHFLAEDPDIVEDERLSIELVANNSGYNMLRADTSPVKDPIAEVHEKRPFVVFSACQISRKDAEQREGKPIPQLSVATDVPSGVVRLCELQEQGWSYIRV